MFTLRRGFLSPLDSFQWNLSFQSTKSVAGEQSLLLDGMARARIRRLRFWKIRQTIYYIYVYMYMCVYTHIDRKECCLCFVFLLVVSLFVCASVVCAQTPVWVSALAIDRSTYIKRELRGSQGRGS